ncbi:MAG: hypothetical protein ACRC5C_08525, partial [Bacilli bacterium]
MSYNLDTKEGRYLFDEPNSEVPQVTIQPYSEVIISYLNFISHCVNAYDYAQRLSLSLEQPVAEELVDVKRKLSNCRYIMQHSFEKKANLIRTQIKSQIRHAPNSSLRLQEIIQLYTEIIVDAYQTNFSNKFR